jgi:hypothetical protein
MTIATTPDVARIRSQLTMFSQKAETAFERAFDLQQAGAPSERIDAALAEVTRLQETVRQLREQLPSFDTVH